MSETAVAPVAVDSPSDIKLSLERLPGGGYILHVDGQMHCARTSPEEVQEVIGDLVASRFDLSQPVHGPRPSERMPAFMQQPSPPDEDDELQYDDRTMPEKLIGRLGRPAQMRRSSTQRTEVTIVDRTKAAAVALVLVLAATVRSSVGV